MKSISVTKHNGVVEPYEPKKVMDSILRAGINRKIAVEIQKEIEGELYDRIPTRELYHLVGQAIVKHQLPQEPHFYHFREALAAMGSFDFEKFVKEILSKEGFESQWNLVLNGFCIDHQLDVLANDNQGSVYYIEVKHHRRYHRETGLGTVVEIWGRLQDLKKGYEAGKQPHPITRAWLITNTKFSAHAKKYAKCQGLSLTGWRYQSPEMRLGKTHGGLEDWFKVLGKSVVYEVIQKVVSIDKGK